jgi:hypothetical protein
MLVKEIFRLHKIFFLEPKVSFFVVEIIPTFRPNQYPTIFPRIPDIATAVDKIKTLTKLLSIKAHFLLISIINSC